MNPDQVAALVVEVLHPTPYTLHHTPYTLHPTPQTLQHSTPHTLHPTPYTLHPTPYTLHPTPYTLPSYVSVYLRSSMLLAWALSRSDVDEFVP